MKKLIALLLLSCGIYAQSSHIQYDDTVLIGGERFEVILNNNNTQSQERVSSNNLNIIPSNPCTSDTVKLIIHSYFVDGSVVFNTPTVNINSNIILVYTRYNVGSSPVVSSRIDTATIGTLSAGSYTMIYNETQVISFDSAYYGTDTLYFTVCGGTGIVNEDKIIQNVSVYPNPATDNFQISLTMAKQEKLRIEITDLTGRIVLGKDCVTVPNKNTFNFSTNAILQGIYFVNIYSEQRKLKTEKFAKME